jgi:hypothetical protein
VALVVAQEGPGVLVEPVQVVVPAVLVAPEVRVEQVGELAVQAAPVVQVLAELARQVPLALLVRQVLAPKHLRLIHRRIHLRGKRPEDRKALVLIGRVSIIRLRQEGRKHQRKLLRHRLLVVQKPILMKICVKRPLTT